MILTCGNSNFDFMSCSFVVFEYCAVQANVNAPRIDLNEYKQSCEWQSILRDFFFFFFF